MPLINLTVSGQQDTALAQKLVTVIGRLTKEILNKKPEVTVVTIAFVPEHLWFVDSVTLAELRLRSFHLEIKITDSTNLKMEKATYIQAVHQSLTALLGRLHPISYTAIHELKADAYGYEGQTSEYNYINSQRG